jgi:hypothetical protein
LIPVLYSAPVISLSEDTRDRMNSREDDIISGFAKTG